MTIAKNFVCLQPTNRRAPYRKESMEPHQAKMALCGVPSRRLEDRIRELCATVETPSQTELYTVIAHLRAALREYTLRIENKAVKDLIKGFGKPDRRSR